MLRSQRREPTCELACPAVATKLARSEPAVWTWVVDEREEIVIESHDAWKTKEFVIEFHDAGKIIARLLSARAGALRPDAAVIALLAHAGRTVLVLPRRALLADATFSLTLFRHVGQLFTRIVRSGERLALEENVKRVVELLLATVGHSQRSGVVQVGEMLTEQRSAFAMLGPWDHAAAGEPYRSAALDLALTPEIARLDRLVPGDQDMEFVRDLLAQREPPGIDRPSHLSVQAARRVKPWRHAA